jgi:CBS domain containing-hemolysin-like protein
VPKVGDEVVVDGLKLTVEATDGRRVRTVHVVHTPTVDDEDGNRDD